MAKETSKYPITSFDKPWDKNENDNLPQSGKQMREFLKEKYEELTDLAAQIKDLLGAKVDSLDLFDEEHGFRQSFVLNDLVSPVFAYQGVTCDKWLKYLLSSEDARDPKSPIRSESITIVVKIQSLTENNGAAYLFYLGNHHRPTRKFVFTYITYLEEEDLPDWAMKRIGATAYTKEEIDNMCVGNVRPSMTAFRIYSVGGKELISIDPPHDGLSGVMTWFDKAFIDNLRTEGIYTKEEIDNTRVNDIFRNEHGVQLIDKNKKAIVTIGNATTTLAGVMTADDKIALEALKAKEAYSKTETDAKVSGALQSAKNFTDEEINGLRMDVTPSNTKVDIAMFNAASELIEEIELGLATSRQAGLMSPEYKQKIDDLINTLEAYSEVWAASLVNLNKRVDEMEKRNPDTEIEVPDDGGGAIAPPPDEGAEEIAP